MHSQTHALQSQITNTLKLLHCSLAHDINGLTLKFNKFLQYDQPYLITFMNYQFFTHENNLIQFLANSLKEESKAEEEVRKLLYGFIGDYVGAYREYVGDYLGGIFQKMCAFFKLETSFRPKVECLGPIRQILLNFPAAQISQFIHPKQYHKSLTYLLKVDPKLPMTVKGEIWVLVGIIQNRFASLISYTEKKDVQVACVMQLKELVKRNQNFGTIAGLLRSLGYSLSQNYLDEAMLEELFNYAKAIMIPLADTYGASIAALQLISTQSTLFHPYILKTAIPLFKTLTGLMGHQNKQYKFTVLDTLAIVAKQLVTGISANVEDPKMRDIFNFMGNSMWGILKTHSVYDENGKGKNEEKNRFYGRVISIVKILGILSPLILTINGKRDLKKFFSELLKICNRKVVRAFEETEVEQQVQAMTRITKIKLILYSQKELVSFIGSFAKILEHLEEVQEWEALSLEHLFLIGVRQYPYFLQKYVPSLVQAMVQFLMGLYTKPHIFLSWCKKIILISLMQSLDSRRFNINTNADYYKMITKSAKMWGSILTHTGWQAQIRKEFSNLLFESLEHLFLNLDVSYKTSMEIDIEGEPQQVEAQLQRQQQLELVNIFFMSDQNLEMSNLADYQYISSLALIFNQLMLSIDASLYTERVYGFYQQIVYRIKIFPKSIPLMKVIRSLNMFIGRVGWFAMEGDGVGGVRNNRELVGVIANFFGFVSENIYKLQENYFFEALKMLLSIPINVFLLDECSILKNSLPGIISKSLQLGQQIITLAYETIKCLSNLFKNAKQESIIYLTQCIPFLEKYINFTKNKEITSTDSQQPCQQKQQVRSYLFLYQAPITRKQISTQVMKFLGSIGGIAHTMVQNSTKDYISWDYYCKLDLTVVLGGESVDINLTKLLARTCWLMLHGNETQKIISSQFMHGIVVFVIGRAAFRVEMQTVQQSKQNLSNFFDRVLPTILAVSSNQSHPCQQLMHTLTIQTIHFLANTQDSNSPDIQTLLKNLIAMYTGAEDLSFLASKCLSELVKWHIKQAPQVKNYPFPLVKTVIRHVWSLISNKKARNGLIQFLIKFLKAIHRHAQLMSIYAIELCSLIISMGRSNRQLEPMLDYLVKKYILSISPYIKSLILQQDSRRFRKLSTLQKLIQWIYNNSLFSIYWQQRVISYNIWSSILGRYGNFFNCSMQAGDVAHNIQIFLSENCDREMKYLFGQNKAVVINEDEPKLEKNLPKITAFGEMWLRIAKDCIFEPAKLAKFRDFQEIYLQSFCSFVEYFATVFYPKPASARIMPYETQKRILDCIINFVNLSLKLEQTKSSSFITEFMISRVNFFQKRSTKEISFIQILLKLAFRPNSLIPNFNYDLIYQCSQSSNIGETKEILKVNQAQRKQQQQNYYFTTICQYLHSMLANNLIPTLESYIKKQLKIENLTELIPYIAQEPSFYDRQIKCILSTMSIFANMLDKDNPLFCQILKNALQISVNQIQQASKKSIHEMDPTKKAISSEKKSMLIMYILDHADRYGVIRDFLVAVIRNETVIYQKYERAIMRSIINNWGGVGEKIVGLVRKNVQFLKLIFVLCKMLPQEKKTNLYSLMQQYLIGIGLEEQNKADLMAIANSPQQNQARNKKKTLSISQMLKICFYFVEDVENYRQVSQQFECYVYDLACQALDIGYSVDLHEQGMNLAGLLIRQSSLNVGNNGHKYQQFVEKFRVALSKLTTFYIPTRISKLPSSQARNKCSTYLKIFKQMVILSNSIQYLQFILSLLKDQQLPDFYSDLLLEIITQCIASCYEPSDAKKQYEDLAWMLGFYWEPGLDGDCWANVRVVFVEVVVRGVLRRTRMEVLVRVFQEQGERLLNEGVKKTIGVWSAKEVILGLELRRAALIIIEELYSHLPKKQKNTEDIYKKQLHKQIIKYCNEMLKSKSPEFTKQFDQIEQTLKQYDIKTQQQQKQKLVILKTQKLQGKKPKAISYLRNFYCSVYNCLIVIFISTQSNKAHFQSYLFESKGTLWRKIVEEGQTDWGFEIQTNFAIMEPVTKINRKLGKKIKDKYWQSSLYAIEEEYVPASQVENPNQQPNPQPQPQSQPHPQLQPQPQQQLQLDPINKHPCMINLLRVIDFMHEKFYDGTLPGWMKPLYDELSTEGCPLAIRILLTKLVVNRPGIFTQGIWPEVLLRYLTLKENGGKFIHYYFRDTLKHYLSFLTLSYKPPNSPQLQSLLMKVLKSLPHENLYIYNDNMQMLTQLLRIPGLWLTKSTVVSMLKANDKNKPEIKQKFEWRMCMAMVLKCAMEFGVPVLEDGEAEKEKVMGAEVKYKFYYWMRRDGLLNLIFEMAGETTKKYRIAASGFLGQLLKFVTASQHIQKLQQQQLVNAVTKFLCQMTSQQSNRNSKQKFSLCILHIASRYPPILSSPKIYNTIQTSLSVYTKQQRLQILETIHAYIHHILNKNNGIIVAQSYLTNIFITIRSIIVNLLNDIQEVQSSVIGLLGVCCRTEVLICKEIIETYYYVYEELERVFACSAAEKDVLCYYKMLIALKDFTSDPDLPKSKEIRHLGEKIGKSLLKGLGSGHEEVRKLLFEEFEREAKNYGDLAERMLDILVKLYDAELQNLWLINVVPLIFSIVKQSSDYTRLRFEKPLADITSYYDWDFRKNIKMYNSSQPFTPAFTLSTGAVRRPDGTIEPSFNPTMGGDRLRGIIRASQNSYMSQQEQVFTMLASQSDYAPSFQASLGSGGDKDRVPSSQASQGEDNNNKLNKLFLAQKKKRNKNMQQFKQNNMRKYTGSISVVNNNKIRFNKKFEKAVDHMPSSYNEKNQPFQISAGNKKISVRKYKVGELPDIQISTKDIIDPMMYLSSCDNEFASELFILIFIRICMYSRKEKKQKYKETICRLLSASKKCQYNFISTLEKCLICLCHNLKQRIDYSMKQIAMKSSTIDYAIVFTEQNQIQTLRLKLSDFESEEQWRGKVDEIWGDLVDLYQRINEEDLIYGVLIRLASGDQKKLLLEALNYKKMGNIRKSQEFLNGALAETNNRRIKQFIMKQKIDCSTIMGDWQTVTVQINKKLQNSSIDQSQSLSISEQKILTIALQNTKIQQKSQFLRKLQFHDTKCQYEKAILQILYERGCDAAYIHLQKSIEYFSQEWRKISSFAFNSKHSLMQQVQKKYQLQQFLELYRKDVIQNSEYQQLFSKWSSRQPNSVYDSNLTFLQILESRRMFADLLSEKFKIDEKFTIRSMIDWLIQMANGMVEKGVLGGAETLIKKALICKRKEKELFIWEFYESVAKLKLKQLLTQKSRVFNDYEIVANLVKKEMDLSQNQVSDLEKLKFVSLKNTLFEAYISSCLSSEKNINNADFINKMQLILSNYNQIKKSLKQNANQQGSQTKQFVRYRREIFFKFTLFLQKMLSFSSQKNNYPELRQAMLSKNYRPERLSHIFVQTLFSSIEYSDFSNTMGSIGQNMILSLIMKLLKIIQLYPSQVGQYFADTISNKRIPVWIFLYFVPQMIKFINNVSLVSYFQDLFRAIANTYPEALVYYFNCSYQLQKDCATPFCAQLLAYLRQKMNINYLFIDALVLLQYPEIRLREALNKFVNIEYERENAILELKQLTQDGEYLGKYNKKFVQDWQSKINRVLNKIKSNDMSVMADIKTILTNIDPNNKENAQTVALGMRDFVKISDGSLFFEQYNSNDWNRIEIPGTSYRKFEEPRPWKKIYIESFDYSLLTLQSKQRPRRITVYGSNQKKYMLLIKAGEDVRLDQRIEEMFEIMNRILRENSECSKKQLQVRRFEVTPIKKMMGIFQWVDESQTLKEFLETEFKIVKETDKVNFKERNKAFECRMEFLNKLSPAGMGNKDPNHQHKALLSANKPDVVKCFIECQRHIPYGLLRRALERLSKNYDSFLHIKNSFIANYALICCITYILGIGDRHLENFLIHMSSASIVPIDFGFCFGSSFELGVPELMPFRLTKTFEELMDPIGSQGVFKKSMLASFEAFSENVILISDYCQVFVDDPLLQWVWTNKKGNTSQSNKNPQFSNSQDPPEKAYFTQKIISVRKKLQGGNPRMLFQNMLTNSRHKHANYTKVLVNAIWGQSKNREKNLGALDIVDELIGMATDKNILGRTYIGWNPYV